MCVLAIDTANNKCSVAFGDSSDNLIDFIIEENPSQQSRVLFSLIKEILSRNNKDYIDIEKILVAIGPGSFTGIRIGVAACIGLKISLNVPIIGITNLQSALFINEEKLNSKTAVILDAYRNQVYVECFENFTSKNEPQLLKVEDIEKILPKDFTIAGSGVKYFIDNVTIRDTNAIDLIKAYKFVKSGELKQYDAVPFYIREADVTMPKKK